jgi:multiple antibiotic resistance protein
MHQTLYQLSLEVVTLVLGTISALLPIANPLTTVAVLPAIAGHLSPVERARQVRKACYYMAAIVVIFLLVGALLMDFFSISIPGLRIAGGLIVCKFGFNMLFPPTEHPHEQKINAKRDISFSPLAMPTLSGPGSIAVVISMSTGVHSQTALPIWLGYLSVVVGILLVAYIAWLVLRASERLTSLLGNEGIEATSRIMGFLLICIGVQFVINGIANLLHDPQFWPELLTL